MNNKSDHSGNSKGFWSLCQNLGPKTMNIFSLYPSTQDSQPRTETELSAISLPLREPPTRVSGRPDWLPHHYSLHTCPAAWQLPWKLYDYWPSNHSQRGPPPSPKACLTPGTQSPSSTHPIPSLCLWELRPVLPDSCVTQTHPRGVWLCQSWAWQAPGFGTEEVWERIGSVWITARKIYRVLDLENITLQRY